MKNISKKLFSGLIMSLLLTVICVIPAKASLFCPGETEDSLCDCYYLYDSEQHWYWCYEHDQQATDPEDHYDEDGDGKCDAYCGYDANYVPGGGTGGSGEDSDDSYSETEMMIALESLKCAMEECYASGLDVYSFDAIVDPATYTTVYNISFSDKFDEFYWYYAEMIAAEWGIESFSLDINSIAELTVVMPEGYSYEYTGNQISPEIQISSTVTDFYGEFFDFYLGDVTFENNVEPGTAVVKIEVILDGESHFVEQDFQIVEAGSEETEDPDDSGAVPPAVNAGWKEDSVGRWYQYADGTYPKNGWKQIEGEWYYFNGSGYVVTGWLKVGTSWYYLDNETGVMAADGWYEDTKTGEIYCFDANGVMQTGWYEETYQSEGVIYSVWYYFKPDGSLATGWQQVGRAWYYFDPDYGFMYFDGEYQIGTKTYRFTASGAMVTGWYQDSYGDWYYYTSSGSLATGWLKVGGSWYYFDPEYGYMYSGGPCWIDNEWYVLKDSGAMATGWVKWIWEVDTDGYVYYDWYYANPNGTLKTGWAKIGGSWYYFDPDYAYMYYGGYAWIEEDDEEYFFKDSGEMVTGWYLMDSGSWTDVEGNKHIYEDWLYCNADGTLYNGWLKSGGKWYYIDYGYMLSTVSFIDEDGKAYYLQDNGTLYTTPGWAKVAGINALGWFYVKNTSGELQTGWKTIGNKEYYFLEYQDGSMYPGEMLYSCEYAIGSYLCTFDENGVCINKEALPE